MEQAEKVEIIELQFPEVTTDSEWVKLNTHPEDDIWIKREQAMSRQLYVSMQTCGNVTWWKGAEIVRCKDDQLISSAETQDANHGPVEGFHAISNFEKFSDYKVYLSKAKFLGIHTRMYVFTGESMFGWYTHFEWRRDA